MRSACASALKQLAREAGEHELKLHREFRQKVFISANGISPRISASIEKISESVNLLARIDEQLMRKSMRTPVVGHYLGEFINFRCGMRPISAFERLNQPGLPIESACRQYPIVEHGDEASC